MRLTIFIPLLLFSSILSADVKLPVIFGDNMVLQRDMPLNIWGWASPGEKIIVEFSGQKLHADTDKNGEWAVRLSPLPSSTIPQNLKVQGNNELKIRNVLVGDVWLCSGQSNMQWPVSLCNNANTETESSDNLLIRHIKVPHITGFMPQNDIPACAWALAGSKTTGDFTATGYFFAREIVMETGVPVGLINSSWASTRIEPWIPIQGFKDTPELEKIHTQIGEWSPLFETGKMNYLKYLNTIRSWTEKSENAVMNGKNPPSFPASPFYTGIDKNQPTANFNSMINPLVNFGIRGVIWYQGETNGAEGMTYAAKMEALISSWRALWSQGDFSFFYVQLANFQKPSEVPAGGDGWAKLREAQLKVLESVPNTGMAVAIDIGEADNIHPKNKQDVGKRLAVWALAKDYGRKVVFSGPLFKTARIEGNKIILSFENAGSGLVAGKYVGSGGAAPSGGKIKGFAISGKDKNWHWADAVVDGDTVVVSSNKIPEPVAVRYAFSMNPDGANLYNKEGFPASPFRTDDWSY